MLLSDIFFDHPLTKNLPLISGAPWKYFSIAIGCLFTVQVIIPRWMKQRKPFELKPFGVIIDGLLFGSYSIGFFIGLTSTYYETIFLESKVLSNQLTIRSMMQILLAFIFFCLLYVELIQKVINMMMKIEDPFLKIELATVVSEFTITYLGLKYNPHGRSTFYPLLTAGINSIVKGLQIFYSISATSFATKQLSKRIYNLKITRSLALFTHAVFVLTFQPCFRSDILFVTFQLFYSCLDFFCQRQKLLKSKQH